MSHAQSINDLKCSMQPWKKAIQGPKMGRAIAAKTVEQLQQGVSFLRGEIVSIDPEAKELCSAVLMKKYSYYSGCRRHVNKELKPSKYNSLTGIIENYQESIQKLNS